MAAISLNRCGLLPGGGGGGAGMEEAHPLNWRLVRTAALLYGNAPLEVGVTIGAYGARRRCCCCCCGVSDTANKKRKHHHHILTTS